MKLQGELAEAADIGARERDQMLGLMERHYEHVSPAVFDRDLAEKDWVILLLDETGAVRGFSTQMLLDVGPRARALFSGDTIVDRELWGQNELARVWGRLALSLIDGFEPLELYWFLVSQGHRTYRFLPVFFREFYPRPDHVTPGWADGLIGALAARKFGAAYVPDAGVVRATSAQYRLKDALSGLGEERLRDPHVRFFVERNPGHGRGDELCCIAPLTRGNFTPAAYRVIGPEPVVPCRPVRRSRAS